MFFLTFDKPDFGQKILKKKKLKENSSDVEYLWIYQQIYQIYQQNKPHNEKC